MGLIGLASLAVLGAVAFLILGPRPAGLAGTVDVSGMPGLNASLNGLTSLLLLSAYALIRRKNVAGHRRLMLAAFFTSTMFLVSYLIYHSFKAAPQSYTGPYPALYFAILTSHVVLAAGIVPLALLTLYRGWFLDVARHRRIARITLPLWLYVSVTGVLIYLMLY